MCPYHAISKDKSLKRLLIVNFLYSFLAAAMAVLVPLYLIDNEFDLTQIGILLAIAPLTFAILRINFASIADEFGTKLIDILYSVSGLLSIAIYVASSTVFAIAIAILGESIRTSAFWAVVRTEIIYGTNNPKGALAFFSGIRQFADAFGRIAIGFILAVFAFQNSFLLLGLISLILLYLAFSSIDNKHKPIQSINYGRDIFKKIGYPHPATFWQASILLGLVCLPSIIFLGFLIPVYARSVLELDYEQIGSLVAIFSFVAAAASFLSIRWKLNITLLLLIILASVPVLFFFESFGSLVVVPVILVAISTGCGNIIYEYIMLDQIYRSKAVSTDIGVLNVPLKLMEFVFLVSSGFLIAQFGFWVLFAILAVATVLFVIFARAFIKS